MRFIVTVVSTLGLSASLIAAGNPAGGDSAGKSIFLAKCVTCHAKDAKGNPAMAKMFKVDQQKMDLTGEDTQKQSPEELTKIVTGGRNKMPSFKGKLKDEEIAAVVAYVHSLGGGATASSASK